MRSLVANGDGVGPELIASAKSVIEHVGVRVNWVPIEIGHAAAERTGKAITEEHLKVRLNRAVASLR